MKLTIYLFISEKSADRMCVCLLVCVASINNLVLTFDDSKVISREQALWAFSDNL